MGATKSSPRQIKGSLGVVRALNETVVSNINQPTICQTTGNIIFLAGGTNVVIWDGVNTPTTVAHGAASPTFIVGRGSRVLVGIGGAAANWRYSTNEATTFANATTSGTNSAWNQAAVGGDNGASTVFCVAPSSTTGGQGQISTTGGASFTDVSITGASQGCKGIASDGGIGGSAEWLAVMTNSTTRKSITNGSSWAAGNSLSNNCIGCNYANGLFIAWDVAGLIYYAATVGTAWTSLRAPSLTAAAASQVVSVDYFNSRWYVLDANGNLWSCANITASDPGWIREMSFGAPLTAAPSRMGYIAGSIAYGQTGGVLYKIAA